MGTTNIASIKSSGIVTGVSVGTTITQYTVANANNCSSSATSVVAINPKPNG